MSLVIAIIRRSSRNWLLAASILLVLMLLLSRSVSGQTVTTLHQIRNVYVETFQGSPGAAFIRGKLVEKVSKGGDFVVVNDPKDADAILEGNASLWITRYHSSDPRILYLTSRDTPVYTARLSLTLRNSQGKVLWSASFKPRFWGFQYVSDNVTNQAICHLRKFVR